MFDMSLTFDDFDAVERAVNLGIDSRLEGFTRSKFEVENVHGVNRLQCQIHPDEMQILIRRLLESGDCHDEDLADNIVYIEYGHETI